MKAAAFLLLALLTLAAAASPLLIVRAREQARLAQRLSALAPGSAPAIRHSALFPARPSFKRHYAATVRGIRRHMVRHGIDVLVEG